MYSTLQDILTQIESCGFQCAAGDLRNNTGFQQLVALAAEAEMYRAAYYESQAQLDQFWIAESQPAPDAGEEEER